MEKEKKLIKDTSTYMVANFGAKFLLLIIYPVYTYYVIPADLGIYDLIVSTLTLFYPVVVFSINDALFRWLLDDELKNKSDIIAAGLKTSFINLIILDIVYIAINSIFHFNYGWLILLQLNVGSLYPVFQQISRGLKKNQVFALSGLVYAICFVLLNILFLAILNSGVEGLLISQIIAYGIANVFLIIKMPDVRINWWSKRENEKILRSSMIKYSVMLIPNSSCWWVMNASDRYLIKFFLGNAANGIYSVSHKFPSVLNMVTSVFAMAWQEQAIEEFNSEERDEYYSKIYRTYYKFLFCLCLILLPVTKWFTNIFIQVDYRTAWEYSAALYLGGVFLALATFLGTGYLSVKNTKGSMMTSMLGAAVNIVVDLILLPILGLEAAALSTLLGNFLVWVSRLVQSRKYFNIRVNYLEFTLLIAVNIIFAVAIRFTSLFVDVFLLAFAFLLTIVVNKDVILSLLYQVKALLNARKK